MVSGFFLYFEDIVILTLTLDVGLYFYLRCFRCTLFDRSLSAEPSL